MHIIDLLKTIPLAVLLFCLLIFLETLEQLCFADAARAPHRKKSRYVVGILSHIGGFLVWWPLLTLLPMSEALPLTGLCYVSTTLAARVILKEKVSLHRWIGVAIIVFGATLICMGGGEGL